MMDTALNQVERSAGEIQAEKHNSGIITVATVRETGADDLSRLTWMNSKEAAAYLRKTRNALLIMVTRGSVKPRKLGNRLYFRRIELDRLLESSLHY